MSIKLYGIPNCDKIQNTRAWFSQRDVALEFHDYKKQGVPLAELKRWMQQVGWKTLLNTQGTTWRKLDDAKKESIQDETSALALMQEHASVIKRPVLVKENQLVVGYDELQFAKLI
jgi:arsenate reductase (glutaredoxin)